MNTVLGIIVLLVILLLISTVTVKKKTDKSEIIKILLRQCARWSTASLQDQNEIIAVLHANYGAGYLWALQDIATS